MSCAFDPFLFEEFKANIPQALNRVLKRSSYIIAVKGFTMICRPPLHEYLRD